MLDSLRYIDAHDLATGGDHIPELADVYVDLGLVSRAPQAPAEPAGGSAAEGATAQGDAQRHSTGQLLDRRSPAVLALVGQPGSGKSTLLAQAARRAASHPARGLLGRERVPVLLALREQAESIIADPALALPAVARAAAARGTGARGTGDALPGREPRGWWERQLQQGRCLVLLDGLDEVAEADDRLVVANWVERQIDAFPANHFVVTSRPYGLPASLASRADVYVVRPFTAAQVQLFLDRWCLAAERHATGASGRADQRAVRARARESAARLTLLLREHPALYDLAVNPLLMTMIATAHRYRGALPAGRADLYEEICRVLLSRRARDGEAPELLSWTAKQTLLALLAYQMMRDHVSNLPAERIREILDPLLARFGSVTAEAFLDAVSRNGLLAEAPAGRYSFSHLTFQEYLAARHVSATPDLVKSLTDNVDDPWWHETILLYTANANASPIVAACLDSGTIPALTLAFDCGDASAEIDPDLRRNLDRERARAYEPGCSTEHRRLIAGVQAARLARRTIRAESGTRVCPAPVPADLYWLFLADTHAPQPDRPCDPAADQPATGIWGTEAQAFATWLNSITATATGMEFRLPRPGELQEEAVADALERELPAAVNSAWTQPDLELWLRPGQPHPHDLPGTAVRQAMINDAGKTTLLPQVLTAAVLDVALRIARDLEDARALSSALHGDLTARANSEGRLVELMHAHGHAIARAHAHALGLTRAELVTRVGTIDPEVVRAAGLAPARALADAIAGDLAAALDRAHGRATALADGLDLDLSVLSTFDFDVAASYELARLHAGDLDAAHRLARALLDDPEHSLATVFGLTGFGLDSASALDPALPLPGLLGLPLRWVADGPLGTTLLHVLARRALPGTPGPDFALALASRAGVAEDTRSRAALGRSLTSRLRDLAAAAPHASGQPSAWDQATVLGRLTDAYAPLGTAHDAPGPTEAAALRAVALGLAEADATNQDVSDVLRAVVTTVTLVERRSKDESPAGESVILVLV